MRRAHPLRCMVLVVLVLPACAATPSNPPRPARINHVVFFKLQNPNDAVELINDCDAKLAAIPGVVGGGRRGASD